MTVTLQSLRDRIARIEGFTPPRVARTCPTGWSAVDAALPGGGLMQGAIHEIHGPDPADGAAMGFAVHLMSRFQAFMPNRHTLWSSCRPDLFAPGIQAAGLDPARLLVAHCKDFVDLLFVLEESCKYNLISSVSADIGEIDFSVSRRLHLAAAEAGITLLLLRPTRFMEAPSAAVTRWHAASQSDGNWSLTLFRCRGGRPAKWLMRGGAPLSANDNLEPGHSG